MKLQAEDQQLSPTVSCKKNQFLMNHHAILSVGNDPKNASKMGQNGLKKQRHPHLKPGSKVSFLPS